MNSTDRRQFLQMSGAGVVAGALGSTIKKALAIPANNRTGTINDVEHVVILMQENRPFDHHFGTLRGVRGFADPRAVRINFPLKSGELVKASVFLQPAGADSIAAGFSVPANYGDPGRPGERRSRVGSRHSRVDPTKMYRNHQPWQRLLPWNRPRLERHPRRLELRGNTTAGRSTRARWRWPTSTRASIFPITTRWPTLSRCWTTLPLLDHGPDESKPVLSVDRLRSETSITWARGERMGFGSGPITGNGLSPLGHYPGLRRRFPSVLDKAGVTWKVYQDLGRRHVRAGLRRRRRRR